MVRPPLTPPITPVVAIIASRIRAPAVSGKPVSASWIAPMKFTPARSRMMLAVITVLGSTSTPAATTATVSSVAKRPPATCW